MIIIYGYVFVHPRTKRLGGFAFLFGKKRKIIVVIIYFSIALCDFRVEI
jgi:hypothetical protein